MEKDSKQGPVKYNWPDNDSFVLKPILIKSAEFAVICEPVASLTKDVLTQHISTQSRVIQYKKPRVEPKLQGGRDIVVILLSF